MSAPKSAPDKFKVKHNLRWPSLMGID